MNAYQSPASFDFYKVDDFSIIMNGREVTLQDIEQKDVLNILSTGTTANDNVTIYVTRDVVTGKATKIDTDEETVTIDDTVFMKSDAYIKAGKYKDPSGNGDAAWTEIKLGEAYNFHLDKFGKIAYVEPANVSNEYDYIYATKVYESDGYFIRAFTLASKWERIPFAEKVQYNGTERYKEHELGEKLDGNLPKGLYRVKYNSDGEVTSIETATATDDADVYNKKVLPLGDYQWSANMSGMVKKTTASVESVPVIIDGTCKVMFIPNNGDESDYMVTNKSYFKVDDSFSLVAYDLDEFNRAKVVIVDQQPTISYNSTPMIVDDIKVAYVDNEKLPIISGATVGNNNFSAVGNDENVFNGVSRGDLIVMSTTATGRVREVKPLCKPSDYGKPVTAHEPQDEPQDGETYNNTYYNKETIFAAGFIEDIDYSSYMLKLNTGNQYPPDLLQGNAETAVFVYDMAEETLSSGTIKDIIKSDYAFVRINWSRTTLIYVIRK